METLSLFLGNMIYMNKKYELEYEFKRLQGLINDKTLEKGLFHKPKYSAIRIHLDTPWQCNSSCDPIARFSYSYMNSLPICSSLLDSDYLVCLLIESDKNISRKDIIALRECSINIPKNKLFFSYYSDEDDLHKNYIFFKDSLKSLTKYVWNSISKGCSTIEPYCVPDIFLANINAEHLINIYDDRGMDILTRDVYSTLKTVDDSLATISKLCLNLDLEAPEVFLNPQPATQRMWSGHTYQHLRLPPWDNMR